MRMKKERRFLEGSKEFGKRLALFRKRKGYSIRKTAELANVNEVTYRQWEYGAEIRGEPYPDLARVFGITLEELFGVSSEESSAKEEVDKIISALHSLKSKLPK